MRSPITTGRALAVALLTVLLFGGGSVVASVFLLRSLCEIVETQVAVYRQTPPSTPLGVEAGKAWEKAYRWPCRG